MTQLTIHLLGQFQVSLNGKVITHFATDKVRALLAYLAIENQYPHRREKLAALFWPEKSESTARTNLRRALADLRANIQDQTANPPFLRITRNDIQLNLDGQIEIDCLLVDEFINHGCDNPQDAEQCDHLLELYQGDFLEGFSLGNCISFEEWLVTVREQYRRKVIQLLQQVIHLHQERNHFEQALPYSRQWVALSPWEEEPRRQLMKLLALAGHREEALHQFEDLRAILAEELGIDPEPLTEQLMENILNGDTADIHISKKPITAASVSDTLPEEYDISTELQDTFAGRKEILASLHAKLAEVLRSKNGSVHFISGQAGSGKTWLGREFISQALESHPELITAAGLCNAFTGTGDPYLPFREILSQLCGDFEAQLRAQTITRTYARRLWKIRSTSAQIVHKYGQGLVNMIIPGYVFLNKRSFEQFQFEAWYQELKTLVEEHQHSKNPIQYALLLSQLTTVLQEIAEVAPLILAIDDLHWADSGTLNLLMHLGKHLAGSPILIIGAFRSEEVFITQGDQAHPLMPILNEMKREHGTVCTHLDEASGRDFIQDVLDREPHALDSNFTDYLFKITNGHALFVSELLRDFKNTGVLIKNREERWVESGPREFNDLPPKIEGVLALRIQTLPQQTQQYLIMASIQGDIFNAEIIAEISGQKKKKVIQLLNDASTHNQHLIQRQHRSLDETERFTAYKFRHILFQKYLYDSLDLDDRKYMHEQVAYTLEALTEENHESYAAQLARHFQEAGRLEKAIQYYVRAAERAKRMIGYEEATNLFETALVLNQQLPASTERDQQELTIQVEISRMYQIVLGAGHGEVKKVDDRIWELCQTLEPDENHLNFLSTLRVYPGEFGDRDRINEIEELIKKIRSKMRLVPIHDEIQQWLFDGRSKFNSGRKIEALQDFNMAVKLYSEVQEKEKNDLVHRLGINSYFEHSNTFIHLGEYQQAIENREKIYQIMKLLKDKVSIVHGINIQTWINLWLREFENCESLLEQFLELTGEEFNHVPDYELFVRWTRGNILVHQHKYDKAIEELSIVINLALKVNAMTSMYANYHPFTEANLGKGDIENTRQAFNKAMEYLEMAGQSTRISPAERLQGNILRLEGKFENAEQHYLEAIQIAQEQSSKTFELYAVEELCRLWHLQGKTEQAHSRLSEMLTQFEGQPDVGILREAKALLQTFQV